MQYVITGNSLKKGTPKESIAFFAVYDRPMHSKSTLKCSERESIDEAYVVSLQEKVFSVLGRIPMHEGSQQEL